MKIEEIKEKLERELAKRGLELCWFPDKSLDPGMLMVFGAEQAMETGEEQLISGVHPESPFAVVMENSSEDKLHEYLNRLLIALDAVGIPMSSLHDWFWRTGRGKTWPTFVVRIKQETFRDLVQPS